MLAVCTAAIFPLQALLFCSDISSGNVLRRLWAPRLMSTSELVQVNHNNPTLQFGAGLVMMGGGGHVTQFWRVRPEGVSWGLLGNWGLPRWLSHKESVCNAEDVFSIPGLGRSPEEGNGNPLQYSCLGNPMDRGVWQCTVHGVTNEWDDLVTKQQQQNHWASQEEGSFCHCLSFFLISAMCSYNEPFCSHEEKAKWPKALMCWSHRMGLWTTQFKTSCPKHSKHLKLRLPLFCFLYPGVL